MGIVQIVMGSVLLINRKDKMDVGFMVFNFIKDYLGFIYFGFLNYLVGALNVLSLKLGNAG
jgi:hypothetical protein